MKRKTFWMILSLLVVTALLFTACQPPEPEETEPPAVEETEPPTEGEEAAEPEEEEAEEEEVVSLRWRTRPSNQAEIDVYQEISDTINERMDNIDLTYEPGASSGSEYSDVLKTELGAGTAPDVFWIPGTDVADFAERGLIYNLRPLAEETESYSDNDFYEAAMYHLTYDPEAGEAGIALWGLPRDVSTLVAYLNLDLIDEAGAPDPRQLAEEGEWDWEAFEEVGKAVNDLGPDIYGYGIKGSWYYWGYWVNSAGGSFYNEDRTACALNTEEAMLAFEFLKENFDEGVFLPFGEDPKAPFLAGKMGMFTSGRWFTPAMRESADYTWDVVEPPTGPGGMHDWLFWGAYVVNADTEHPEEAWQLLLELTSAEMQGKIAELGTNIPSRKSEEALEKFLTYTPPENNQAYINALNQEPRAEGPLWEGDWPEFYSVVRAKVSALLGNEITLEEFQNTVCAEADKTFDE